MVQRTPSPNDLEPIERASKDELQALQLERMKWTLKHALLNAIAQPEQFVEIGEKLAGKLGIAHGDTVKVSSNRGYIKAKAVVTKRIRTLNVHGQQVDTIGIPIHWGYEGVAHRCRDRRGRGRGVGCADGAVAAP